VAETQRALDELQSSDPRFEALDTRLAAVLGGATPRDNSERLALAQRAYDTKHYASAARLWAEALDSDPKLAVDRRTQHTYNAACAAALASAGQGRDEPAPDADAKAKLRTQALEWLRNELAAWDRFLAPGPPSVRTTVVQTLQHWKADTDLASLRDPAALALLPSDEQAAWKALWADVDALLRRAQNQPASPPHAPTSELPANPFAPPTIKHPARVARTCSAVIGPKQPLINRLGCRRRHRTAAADGKNVVTWAGKELSRRRRTRAIPALPCAALFSWHGPESSRDTVVRRRVDIAASRRRGRCGTRTRRAVGPVARAVVASRGSKLRIPDRQRDAVWRDRPTGSFGAPISVPGREARLRVSVWSFVGDFDSSPVPES
jgi:hypothetical protein